MNINKWTNELIIRITDYITRYVPAYTVYKFVIFAIPVTWIVSPPTWDNTPIMAVISVGAVIWFINELLYTIYNDDDQ